MIRSQIILVLFCFLWIDSNAQTVISAFVDDSIVEVYPIKGNGNNSFFLTKKKGKFERQLWLYSSIDESLNELAVSHGYAESHWKNESGVFYISEEYVSNGVLHSLNFVDTLGVSITAIPINEKFDANPDKYSPRYALTCDNRLYINGYYNQMHCVWESDGTLSGTQIVFQSPDPIVSMETKNNRVLIVTEGSGNFVLYDYTQGQQALSFYSFASFQYPSFLKIGEDATYMYFNIKNSSGEWEVWRTNFTTLGTSFFTEYNGSRARSLWFKNAGFYMQFMGLQEAVYLFGDTINPTQFEPVMFTEQLKSGHPTFLENLGSGYLNVTSLSYGQELAYISPNDSIALYSDLAKGPKTSFPTCVNGFPVGDFSYFENKPAYFLTEDSVLYIKQTNGNDSSFYLYRHDGTSSMSLFQMETEAKVPLIFQRNNSVYWLSLKNEELTILKRDLSQLDPPQPSEAPIENNWFRQLGYNYSKGMVTSGIFPMYAQEVFLTDSNEVIIGGTLGKDPEGARVFSSDTSLVKKVPGSNVIGKYSEKGDLLWINGIGARYWSPFYVDNKMIVKSNGNVVVVGSYPSVGYFDQDSLNANVVGVFIAELDGATGQVLSKRNIAGVWQKKHFKIDRLTIDENDNVYLAFTYVNFNLFFDNTVSLSSGKSQANGLARFNNDGSLDWVKTIETPWLDNFGNTSVLLFDKERKVLTTVQSQSSNISWSSCQYEARQNFGQAISTEGVIIDTFTLTKHDDLGYFSVGTYTGNGNFFGSGHFRSSMSAGSIVLQTAPLNDCFKFEGFEISYNPVTRAIESASMTSSHVFYPSDIKKTDEGIYVFGKNWDESILILKYTLLGELVGQKKLEQYSNQFEVDQSRFFDVNEDHIVFLGNNFRRDVTNGILPFLSTSPSLSILKIANDGWEQPEEWITVLPELELDSGVIVFPNPFSDRFTVLSEVDGIKYSTYQLFDINGKSVCSGSFSKERLSEITVGSIASGMYLLRLSNATEQRQVRIMRM